MVATGHVAGGRMFPEELGRAILDPLNEPVGPEPRRLLVERLTTELHSVTAAVPGPPADVAPEAGPPVADTEDSTEQQQVGGGSIVRGSGRGGDTSPQPVVVTLPLLRRLASRPGEGPFPEEPFAWKPGFIRRSLGVALLGACRRGLHDAPSVAVGPVLDEALAAWNATGQQVYHWEPWVASLGAGGRAAVMADAVGWATGVWTALPWDHLATEANLSFVATDDQWVCPTARSVRLKARADLLVTHNPGPTRGAGDVLVLVGPGLPPGSWTTELGMVALLSMLSRPGRDIPARVVGLWPEAGAFRVADIDDDLLDRSVNRVIGTVELLRTFRTPAVEAA